MSAPFSFQTSSLAARQGGFTLVELAIVVIVIGLLVGGVTAGQQLVRSAQISRLMMDIDSYSSAILAFNLRYDRMPGDYHAASVHIACSPACLNGNGNQRVETNANSFSGSEMHEELLVWSHLSGGGFIYGNYPPVAGGVVPTPTNSPVNFAQRYLEFVYDANFGTVPGGTTRHNLKTGNQIPASFLQEIDSKIDDGLPNTGNFRFSGFAPGDVAPVGGDVMAPYCTSGPSAAALWNATNGASNCGAAMLFAR